MQGASSIGLILMTWLLVTPMLGLWLTMNLGARSVHTLNETSGR